MKDLFATEGIPNIQLLKFWNYFLTFPKNYLLIGLYKKVFLTVNFWKHVLMIFNFEVLDLKLSGEKVFIMRNPPIPFKFNIKKGVTLL